MIWHKRSWLPFIFLLAAIITIISILFIGNYFPKGSQFPQQPSNGCVIMKDRGNYDKTVDIVFLGDNYKDVDNFVKDTEIFVNSFFEVYPYNGYKDRFNFFRIEQFQNLGCTYDEVLLCSPNIVKLAGSICPHDYFVVLSDIDGVKNLFKFLRSSSWMGVNVLNTADNKLVFVHEFAHSFGDFADEYTWEGGKINWDAPNCDSNWRSCPKFKVVNDSECWRGCVNDEYARSVKVGIMRDYWSSDRYGAYNEYLLRYLLDSRTVASDSDDNFLKSPPINLLVVFGRCSNSICSIDSVEESIGYPDPDLGDSFLNVKTGNNIASLGNQKLFSDYGNEGGVLDPDNFDFVILVEKDLSSNVVILVDSLDNVVDSYNYISNDKNIIFGIPKRVDIS